MTDEFIFLFIGAFILVFGGGGGLTWYFMVLEKRAKEGL